MPLDALSDSESFLDDWDIDYSQWVPPKEKEQVFDKTDMVYKCRDRFIVKGYSKRGRMILKLKRTNCVWISLADSHW
jgi:hypothetical protein